MSRPLVSVIIVSYGTRDLTLAALESVSASNAEVPLEAIVVDNASPDDSADAVQARAPWATLIRSATNGGFATGANQGARVARGDWLLFLNSDARLGPGALPTLLNTAAAVERPGALGPRIEGPEGTERSVGRYYGPWRDVVRAFRLYRLFPRFATFDDLHVRRLPTVTTPVDWVSGACLLIRRDVFRELGGFDEAYFMYVEDMDLCYRLAKAGYVNLYAPDAIAHHERGKSPRSDGRVLIEGGDASEYFVAKMGMRYPLLLQRSLRSWLLASYMGSLGTRLVLQRLRGQDTEDTRRLLRTAKSSLSALLRQPPRRATPPRSLRLER
ncbi:MAG TPA: glycosyltransferase family 2 protein [Candidatus Eisenbacteria bacterium]|nr:glycosyltransferase family 2 protein [Candidatus Eisenbacteria bacterium]